MRIFRFFLSSPGDVAEERQITHEVLETLPQEPAWRGKINIEIVRWDNPYSPTPLYANITPQEAVNRNLPKPSECDVVIVILWARFGTPLAEPLRPDGSNYLSGTEWEYEDALSGNGRVIVYRRMDEPKVNLRDTDFDEKREQLALVDEFFEKFFNPSNAPVGGYIGYSSLKEFGRNIKTSIEATVRQMIETETPSWQIDLVKENEKLIRDLEAKEREIKALKQNIVRTRDRPRSTQGDRDAFQRDSNIVASAPVLPMKLVMPVASHDASDLRPHPSWSISAVGATTSALSGTGVTIALLDTGIDIDHEAFQEIRFLQRDFTGEGHMDTNGHGTHVAGTVFGRPVNGSQIGVAPGIDRVLVGKIVGRVRSSTDWLMDAIIWAVKEGADVILVSVRVDALFLMETYSEVDPNAEAAVFRVIESIDQNKRMFEAMIEFTNVHSPVTIVAAAGNEGNSAPGMFPANLPGVLSVGALGQAEQGYFVSSFSNDGPSLWAPGEEILSAACGGGLTTLSGTSMAAAHVAGIAALWAEKVRKDGLGSTVSDILLSTAKRGELVSETVNAGAGLVYAPQ